MTPDRGHADSGYAGEFAVTEVPTASLPDASGFDEQVDLWSGTAWPRAMSGVSGTREGSLLVTRVPHGTVAACVPVFRHDDLPAGGPLQLDTVLGALLPSAGRAPVSWGPLQVVGSPNGVVTRPDAAAGRAWAAALDVARAASRHGLTVVPYVDHDVAVAAVRRLAGAELLLGPPRVVVDLDGGTIEEVYRAMSAGRRAEAAGDTRLLRRGGCEIVARSLDGPTIGQVARLLAQTQERHHAYGDRAQLEDRYRRLWSSPVGASVTAFVCLHDGAAVATSVAIAHADTLLVQSVGLDYARVGTAAEYFNVLVHAPIRHAVASGLRTVDLGLGGYRQKLLRAGRARLTWSIVLRYPDGRRDRGAAGHNRPYAQLLLATVGGRHFEPAHRDVLERLAKSGEPAW